MACVTTLPDVYINQIYITITLDTENCRVDKLMSVLMDLNEDLHFKYESNLANGTLSSRMLRYHHYHRISISKRMPFCVESETSFQFIDGHSVIKKQNSICCNSVCRYCGIWYHMFTCTCYTYAVSACICKHIHSAARVAAKNEVYEYNPNSACPLSSEIEKPSESDKSILNVDAPFCPPDVDFSDSEIGDDEDEKARLERNIEILKESIQRIESDELFDTAKANELIEQFNTKVSRLFNTEPINKKTENQKRTEKKSKDDLAMDVLTKRFEETQEVFLEKNVVLELFEENGIIESQGLTILEKLEDSSKIMISDEKVYIM